MGGGGKGKGGSPKAPDFQKLAMVNQGGPMGGSTWGQDANGNMTLNQSFSGQNADTFNALQGGMAKAASYDPTQARDAAIASNYNQAASRLDPMWKQRAQAFQSNAANSGLDPGTEAYNNQFGNESRAMNDAYSTAMAGAIRQGNETQAMQLAQMNQPFNQARSMLGMLPQGDPNAPFNAGKAQYSAAKDSSSADQAKKGSTMSGLGSIAGMAFGGPLGGRDLDENLGGYNF